MLAALMTESERAGLTFTDAFQFGPTISVGGERREIAGCTYTIVFEIALSTAINL